MRLLVAAVGRLKSGPERELAARYRERADASGRKLGLRPLELIEVEESRGRHGEQRIGEEAARLAAAIPENAAIVALDAGGKALSSTDLAQRLGAHDAGRSSLRLPARPHGPSRCRRDCRSRPPGPPRASNSRRCAPSRSKLLSANRGYAAKSKRSARIAASSTRR